MRHVKNWLRYPKYVPDIFEMADLSESGALKRLRKIKRQNTDKISYLNISYNKLYFY